jgi:hypothetical protein
VRQTDPVVSYDPTSARWRSYERLLLAKAAQLPTDGATLWMTTDLHVVLSCTHRKRVPPNSTFPRLRDVPADDVDQRASTWIDRVRVEPAVAEAKHLYAGEYWQAGLDLAATASRYFRTTVWVLSAGLGLIRATDPVPAYGATLANGHPDSVVPTGGHASSADVRRAWWTALAAWPGPGGTDGVRTVTELAVRDPLAAIVVCAGRHYLAAVGADLHDAYMAIGRLPRLLVYGSGAPATGLEPVWVRVPGRLRMVLGGSMASTSLRAARATVEAHGPAGHLDAPRARSSVESLLNAAAPLPRFDRERLDDRTVTEWIKSDVAAHAGATKSAALRRFRSDGMACEQSRFGKLFDQTAGAAH